MHFRMIRFEPPRATNAGNEKGGHMGPLLVGFDVEAENLGAQCRRAEGRNQAKGKEKHRGETIEEPLELYERHDTHFPVSGTLIDVRVFLI